MSAETGPFTVALAVPGTLLELSMLGMALYRRLQQRFPIFTAYVGLVTAKDAVGYAVLYHFGLNSLPYNDFYWISQLILVAMRGLVVAELFHTVLQPYPGVWAMARFALTATGGSLLAYAATESTANTSRMAVFVLAADRGLEFAVVGTLLALLALCRYYEVRLDHMCSSILLGLALYSSFTIMNNTVLLKSFLGYADIWSALRRISYDAALLIWLWPLLQKLPERDAAQAMISSRAYRELVPEFSGRMRELNDRLLEILQR